MGDVQRHTTSIIDPGDLPSMLPQGVEMPAVSVYHWESAVAETPGNRRLIDLEDSRELAFMEMAVRQFSAWDEARVGRVLDYLSARFGRC